jgi:hypothetical protein
MQTLFVDDLDALIVQIAEKGLDAAKQETYSNGVRKIKYRDTNGKRDRVWRRSTVKPFSLTQRSECWLKPEWRLGGEDRLE